MIGDFFISETLWLSIPAAIALDLVLGDPHGWPHPIRWMGRAIAWLEPLCRKFIKDERLAGTLFALILVLSTWAAAFLLVRWCHDIHVVFGFIIETVMIYFCLAIRSLMDAAMEIHGLLKQHQLDSARMQLSYIVGRDVARYDAPDIARATVETVAENFVDGVLSPLFFAAVGGAPLMAAYKMVNTMDSMVGYKNERYARFGTAAARLDDVANFLPARLSVLMIALATRILFGCHANRVFKTAGQEGSHHSSPNAGYPEAAFAGALAVKLNGPNFYHGQLVNKPYIGVSFGPVVIDDIDRACRLMCVASLIGACIFWSTQRAIYLFL